MDIREVWKRMAVVCLAIIWPMSVRGDMKKSDVGPAYREFIFGRETVLGDFFDLLNTRQGLSTMDRRPITQDIRNSRKRSGAWEGSQGSTTAAILKYEFVGKNRLIV